MTRDLLDDAHALTETLRAWRRHLHKHPELSGQEAATAAYVAEQLRAIGLDPTVGVGGTHGVVAEIDAGSGPVVALRADMDALPIQEESEVDYRSQNAGVMHACGHDAHTAMLLGAAKLLFERRGALPRPVRLLFQPHEEVFPGGAAALISAGALEDVERVFGIHITCILEKGQLGTRPGAFMAAVNNIDITVQGIGGHAAMPHDSVDPILIGSKIVQALQSIVSRELAPTDTAVVSITQFQAGTTDNVIPSTARLRGTIRTFDPQVRETVATRVRAIAESIAQTHRATADARVLPGYPVLVNDEAVVEEVLSAADAVGIAPDQRVMMAPMGGAEDFAYYCQERPGAFVFLGARNAERDCCHPHHHPRFNVDEDVLPLGAALHAQFALARHS